MSTLRITNIEAKADPSSPTVDEKIKLTNSNGDILVHVDGKTSGITTIGINTTAGNIKFDQNSNVVVTGIITATKFVGTIEPTTLTVGGDLTIPDKIVHTGDTNTSIRFPGNDTFTVETSGSEALRVDGGQRLLIGETTNQYTNANLQVSNSSSSTLFVFNSDVSATGEAVLALGPSNKITGSQLKCIATEDFSSVANRTADLAIQTRLDGDLAERLRITSEGHIKHTGLRNGNSENKLVYYTVPSHDTGEEDVIVFTVANESSSNQITFGGGPSAYNAATEILFRTASAVDTTVGSERLRITSNGMVRVTDSASLTFGNNDDMRIFHDGGSANYIDVYNKDLYIRCNRDAGVTGGDIVLQPKSGENSAIFRDNGNVELYYDNALKLETVSNGTKTTGRIFLNGTNGGFDYNNTAHTLEFLVANGTTHSELTSNAYVPSASGTRHLGYANKRWDTLYVDKIAFGGSANTSQHSLDDYEEGTFTPTWLSGLSNPSYSDTTGTFTKIGNLVTFTLRIQASGTNVGSHARIGSLPFTSSSSDEGSASFGFVGNLPGNQEVDVYLHVPVSNNIIEFYYASGAQFLGNGGNGIAGRTLHIRGFYYT